MNSPKCLREHDQVAQDQRPQRRAAGRERRAGRRQRDRGPSPGASSGRSSGRGGHSRSSFPVRLMNTVSSVGSATDRSTSSNPPRSAEDTTRGMIRSEPLTCSSTPPSSHSRPRHPLEPLPRARSASAASRRRHVLDRDDRVGADRLLERRRRVEREDLAVVHDRHALAQAVGLLHVVRQQHDRLAVGVQLAEDLPQREPALRVEAGGRLVEEQDRRPVEDRARDHQPLRHPARQREHRRLGPAAQVKLLEQLVGRAARDSGRADPEQPPVEVQVLPHGQLAVERVLLGDDPDQLLGQGGVGDRRRRCRPGRFRRWGSPAWSASRRWSSCRRRWGRAARRSRPPRCSGRDHRRP